MAGVLAGARIMAPRSRHERGHRSYREERPAHRIGLVHKARGRIGRSLPAPHHVRQRHEGAASRTDASTPRRAKGIVNIPADIVLESAELLGRVLTVLIGQWGLDAVEVRIAEDKPEAGGVTSRTSRHILTVAGHDFPFVLEGG